MSAFPDGSDPEAYRVLRDVDRAGLMWEWLRRDTAYVGWYVRARAATGGPPPAAPRWHLLFAEDPAVPARHARLLWRADLDPGTLRVIARPAPARDSVALRFHRLRRFLAVVRDVRGGEHAVLSDGFHHLRLDVEEGTLTEGPVALHYLLDGARDAELQLETVRRLVALCAERRFSPELFPSDPHRARCLLLLRVHDALRAGASQRDIAALLFGGEHVRRDWSGASDSLRSRVRRLVRETRQMAAGGYRWLIKRS